MKKRVGLVKMNNQKNILKMKKKSRRNKKNQKYGEDDLYTDIYEPGEVA